MLILGIAILGWAPLLSYCLHNRHRPKTVTLIGAHIRGHFAEALGPRGPALNQAATDLEQITASLRLSHGSTVSKKAIVRAADFRMRRMFDISYGAPAIHGLSKDNVMKTFEMDLQWLEDVRKACEKLSLPGTDRETNETILSDLREHIAAREAAVEELKQL